MDGAIQQENKLKWGDRLEGKIFVLQNGTSVYLKCNSKNEKRLFTRNTSTVEVYNFLNLKGVFTAGFQQSTTKRCKLSPWSFFPNIMCSSTKGRIVWIKGKRQHFWAVLRWSLTSNELEKTGHMTKQKEWMITSEAPLKQSVIWPNLYSALEN